MFVHRYRVAFYDTDAMRVVHHANYIRIMECARVEWLRQLDLIKYHTPHGSHVWAITHVKVDFLKSAVFDDEIETVLEGRLVGARFQIRYALWVERLKAYVAVGETDLVPLVAETLQATRFPMEARERLRNLAWSDVWPPAAPPPRP